jgi:alginate O-acetyltransferase complex protein AlgI
MNNFLDHFLYDPKAPLLFNSGLFLFLFTIFLSVFALLEKPKKLRNLWTVAFSLFFYYKSSGYYFWILMASTVVDYYLGIFIYQSPSKRSKKRLLLLSVFSNLGMLAYFKYTNFFVDILNDFGTDIGTIDLFLPVGISFYTFQTLSYSIDVYRGDLPPERDFWNFSFYVTFFPQLVAGPIVRAIDFIPQLHKNLKVTKEDFGKAVFLIGNGLFKKAVISDYISSNFVDRIFENPTLYSGIENLFSVYGYTLQIYCDFSGYSDMAIGIALLLGFHLPDNFNHPYTASSITEFWRKWHISLSTWLRDYLYISMGGNRKSTFKTYRNLMLTMVFGGLWHGAHWKFVLWGALHGIALCIEKFFMKYVSYQKTVLTKCIGWLLTFHLIAFAWVFFRAESYTMAIQMLQHIATNTVFSQSIEVVSAYQNIFIAIAIGYALHFNSQKLISLYKNSIAILPTPLKALYLSLIIWLSVQVSNTDVIPFIYFQF